MPMEKLTDNIPYIRVTTLEAFRRWRDYEIAYGDVLCSEEDVIASVSGEFHGNTYTKIGTAFHSIVETGKPQCRKLPEEKITRTRYNKPYEVLLPEGREFDIEGDKVKLDIHQCKVALDYRNEMPHASHEVRLFKNYGDAIITGCADVVNGLDIHDIKTKYGQIKDEDYSHSCQWKFYLDMFGLDWFFFDLFQFHGYDVDKNGFDVRGLELTRYKPAIWCERYPRMRQDNLDLIHDFLWWCNNKGLTKYLTKDRLNIK